MKLAPATAEEKAECETPEGMRRRLFKYSYDHPMVKNVMDAARYRGLSGDDTMTWLAFEALCRLEHMEELVLDDFNSRASTFVVRQKEII